LFTTKSKEKSIAKKRIQPGRIISPAKRLNKLNKLVKGGEESPNKYSSLIKTIPKEKIFLKEKYEIHMMLLKFEKEEDKQN
jgi:hypothetical protein